MYINKEIEDSFQAFLVEGARFTNEEEYPIIENWMVPDDVPDKVMPFSKAITYKGDLSKHFIYFFSPDKTFERIRKNPRRYLMFFKRTAGIIGFDYSVHTDMPIVKQKSQMNDNLSLTYYYGKNGIKVYPSIRCGSDCLEDEYLLAFPKNTIVALGVHGFIKKKYQQHEWRYFIEKVIKKLNPKALIVIGRLTDELIDEFSSKVKIVSYDSYIEERIRENKNYGN